MSATIVTCYYKIGKSKHSEYEYDCWIKNFVLNINAQVVLFTNKSGVDYIKHILKENNNLQCHIIVKELDDLAISIKYPREFWESQYEIDTRKDSGRGIGCYKIWNSKFSFLQEAIDINPFNSDKFIWNDIGNVRDSRIISVLNSYPDHRKMSNNKLDIILLRHFQNESQLFFQEEVHFSGSMFGGGKDAILELCKLYYLYFEMYARQNKFIGCDQQIISTLYLKNKDKINCVIPKNCQIDPWFYLYQYYS